MEQLRHSPRMEDAGWRRCECGAYAELFNVTCPRCHEPYPDVFTEPCPVPNCSYMKRPEDDACDWCRYIQSKADPVVAVSAA